MFLQQKEFFAMQIRTNNWQPAHQMTDEEHLLGAGR
jgi:hypothetical protein